MKEHFSTDTNILFKKLDPRIMHLLETLMLKKESKLKC